MKVIVCLVLVLAAFTAAEEKKTEKRGVLGLGYGGVPIGHGLPVSYGHSLGYGGVGLGHALPVSYGHSVGYGGVGLGHALPVSYGHSVGYGGVSLGHALPVSYGHSVGYGGLYGQSLYGQGLYGHGLGSGYPGYLAHSAPLITKAVAPLPVASPWLGGLGHGYPLLH